MAPCRSMKIWHSLECRARIRNSLHRKKIAVAERFGRQFVVLCTTKRAWHTVNKFPCTSESLFTSRSDVQDKVSSQAFSTTQNPHVTFTDQCGEQHKLYPSLGDHLLSVAQARGLELEGACGGLCACSTCHVLVENQDLHRIPEPEEDEQDMLESAHGRTESSRLGCQVKVTEHFHGLQVKLPQLKK